MKVFNNTQEVNDAPNKYTYSEIKVEIKTEYISTYGNTGTMSILKQYVYLRMDMLCMLE